MANYTENNTRSPMGMRRLAAFVAGLLAFLMIASTITGAFSASAVSQETVNQLKNQLSSVTSKKNNAKKELASIQSKKSSILAEIEKLDAAIEAATEEIEVQQQLITELEGLIEVKTGELEISIQKEEEQYLKLKNRVRFMHENGSMSYLSILLSSDDFADFLSRYEIVSQISKYDKKLFEELKALKEQVAEQKASLESDHADAVALKGSMDENKKALEVQYSDRNAQMRKVEEAEADAKAQYAEIAKEEDKITAAVQKAVRELAAQSNSTYVGGSMMWPLPAANNVVTCKYGMRTHPITGVYKLHTGIDLRASTGTKIYSANAGTVIKATYSSAYGYYVVVDHGGGTSTLYAHMSKMAAKKGQKVSQGTVLGYVGSTGYSTGPHLHFEIIKKGNYVNPISMYPNFKVVYK